MQHLHSVVAVCETAMQHLHSLVAVCETTMQPLHSLVAVYETAMQHLHSLAAVCETAMQPLHSLAAVCETAMQPLHSLAAVCETAMQPLHSLVAVCAPVPRRLIIRPRLGPSGGAYSIRPYPRVPGKLRRRPQTPRLIIRPRPGPSGGGECNSPLPRYPVKIRCPRRGRMQFAPTCTRQTWLASLMPKLGWPSADALHLPHTQIFNVYEEQQTTQHNADDGARRADRSAELAAPQATR